MKLERPQCSEIRATTGKQCTNPARYYIDWGEVLTAVCGNCARRYITKALHPLRVKEWYKD